MEPVTLVIWDLLVKAACLWHSMIQSQPQLLIMRWQL
jgi:hypothetical protein